MQADSIDSGWRRSKDVVEEIRGYLGLALLSHQGVAVMNQGVDVFPPTLSICMGMEETCRRISFL
jgi:hypothetical protein